MASEWTSAPAASALTGDEELVGIGATVRDFWQFAMSDLRMNNIRGYLAEFLVVRAVGASASRVEWDAFDVVAPSGARIEVKSSGYLQAWEQRDLSRIVFTGLTGRTWTPQNGESPEATYNADVYVFCVQTATSHQEYDPLDVAQWDFYVLPRRQVEALNYKSLGLPTLTDIAGSPSAFDELAACIDHAYATETSSKSVGT
jgi:hypothetical protein